MRPGLRSFVVVVCVWSVLSCEDDRGFVVADPSGGLEAASACKVEAIEALIPEIYVEKKHESEAAGRCRDVRSHLDRGRHLEAVTAGYQWLAWTYDLWQVGGLLEPGSEGAIQQLFDVEVFGVLLAPAFAALPDDDPPNLSNLAAGLALQTNQSGVVAEFVDGTCDGNAGANDPCLTVTPNRHAGVQLKKNGAFVVVTVLPPTQTYFGECIAIGDGLGHDCFNDQLQVAVFPAGEAVDAANPAIVGVCVDDFATFSPGNRPTFGPSDDPSTLPADIGVTKGEVDANGLVFLPDAQLPAGTLDCTSGVSRMDGLRGAIWDALGPAQRLFRVTPAYADPGPVGAAFSQFSPVVPADRIERNGTLWGAATSVFDEVSGADVTVYDCTGAVFDDPAVDDDLECVTEGSIATLVGGGPATTVTDADGNWVVGALPAATTYAVTVVRNGNLQDAVGPATLTAQVRDAELEDAVLTPPGQS